MSKDNRSFEHCFEFIEARITAKDYRLTLVELRDRFFPDTSQKSEQIRIRVIEWMKDKPFCWDDWIRLPRKVVYDQFCILLDKHETLGYKINHHVIAVTLSCSDSIVRRLLISPRADCYHKLPLKKEFENSGTDSPARLDRTTSMNTIIDKTRKAIIAEMTLYELGLVSVVSRQAKLARHFGVSNELARKAVGGLPQNIKERYEKAPKTPTCRSGATDIKELIHARVLRDVRDFWHNRTNVVVYAKQIRQDFPDCPKSIASCLPPALAKEWRKIIGWQVYNVQCVNREIAQLALKEIVGYFRGEQICFTNKVRLSKRYNIPRMVVARVLRHTLSPSFYKLHAAQCRGHSARAK